MLAAPLFPHLAFMPSRPSPLSERHANAAPRPFTFTMASSSNEKRAVPVSQRAYKPNPLVQSRDAAAQKRRDMFFRKVQKGRDDKKWDARGEQIQRLDYISEHKRWEAEKARQAPEVGEEIVDDEEGLPIAASSFMGSSAPQQQPEQEVAEAEYMIEQEEWELQQLIASMEEQERDNVSQHYGSDDEDYNSIFMECASEDVQGLSQASQADIGMDDVDEMDMS
ncbi:hypothetical protein CC80DRAFT_438751 [Byssothecium circinans]|uniref:Uncharacterized protein n=1 Tax=Byssothecium circinans TaxID=147558 RepID=A0A6A5U665_9PLEO|nr:hypothetical protein CC80DRAFT_438751 [Byssothecium circinans]